MWWRGASNISISSQQELMQQAHRPVVMIIIYMTAINMLDFDYRSRRRRRRQYGCWYWLFCFVIEPQPLGWCDRWWWNSSWLYIRCFKTTFIVSRLSSLVSHLSSLPSLFRRKRNGAPWCECRSDRDEEERTGKRVRSQRSGIPVAVISSVKERRLMMMKPILTNLCFETERGVNVVGAAFTSLNLYQEVSGVQLDTRLVGPHLHLMR